MIPDFTSLAVTNENYVGMCAMMDGNQAQLDAPNEALWKENKSKCSTECIEIKVEEGVSAKIFIIKPNDLPKAPQAAYVYAHGGGACFTKAEDSNNLMAVVALNLRCIVFNVDFRNAPEAKAPKGANDFALAILHVYNNAEKYGVNKKEICMAGISGGGHICLGAANILAKKNCNYMVKAQFLQTPMISDLVD